MLSSQWCNSQDCLDNGIELNTQSQIDSFKINYPHCKIINGNLIISSPSSIHNLDSLSNIVQIRGFLHISADSLKNLKGLNNLRYVENRLIINGCLSLENLNGLQNLISTGDLRLINNDSINTLEHLNNLKYVNGEFTIQNYNNLKSLDGLDSLLKIGEHLSIGSNDQLKDISSLKNLTAIGGILQIFFNDELTSLDGLNNIDPNSIDELYLQYNPKLEFCNTRAICQYLVENIGYYELIGNKESCNSKNKILNLCEIVSTDESDQNSSPLYFPNPTEDVLHLKELKIEDVQIFNFLGNKIMYQIINNNTISLKNMPCGIYFIYSKSKQKKIGKVIKQ